MNAATSRAAQPVDATAFHLSQARKLLNLVPGAVLCRRTAARAWDMAGHLASGPSPSWPVELAVGEDPRIGGCAVSPPIRPASDVTVRSGLPVTTLERTTLDCARWLPRLEAVAILDQALRQGVAADTLKKRAMLIYGAAGGRRVREMLTLSDPRAGSPRESWIRVVIVDAHLPRPTAQLNVPLPSGRTTRLDLGWEQYKLGTEYDGREHHSADDARRADDQRRAELNELGWLIIPVRADAIPAHTADYITQLANALLQRGWRPSEQETLRVLAHIRALRRRSTPLRRKTY
ncbi:hypothetical protein SAMN05421505_13326 [Sinosporangium album]|uniref:DUF559 domain-containing protein n=1 Tax=Sinosporangium album TaxID=504805 RepID=A0A1G8HNR0_9ACTN|nr:hypothetical protein [Sinosporangium album]SDI08277.1 hypothetical protein SAMN05421505_13326 [Sinosporangium album]